jgi:hypothetical protein
MADSIYAITIWQPWATLIAEGAKRYEFRSWAPAGRFIGSRIAIHAGARPAKRDELGGLLLKLTRCEWRETGIDPAIAIPLLERWMQAPKALPLSSVVCTAVLGRPIRNQELAEALGTTFINDSDRDEHSNYGWPLSNIIRLEPPVPARGAQGWWNWNPGEHHAA